MLGMCALDFIEPALPFLGCLGAVGQRRRPAKKPVALHAGRKRYFVEVLDCQIRTDWQWHRYGEQRHVIDPTHDPFGHD